MVYRLLRTGAFSREFTRVEQFEPHFEPRTRASLFAEDEENHVQGSEENSDVVRGFVFAPEILRSES